MFNNVAGYHEVERVVLEGQSLEVQVRKFEGEPSRQRLLRRTVIHPKVLKLAQPQGLRRPELPEADAADVQDLARAGRQLVSSADFAWRPRRDDLPNSHISNLQTDNHGY
jgi:hypothetical protein